MKKAEFSSGFVVLFLLYVLWVWLGDAVGFLFYLAGIELSFPLTALAGIVLVLPVFWWVYRYCGIGKLQEKSWFDAAAVLAIFLFFFVKALLPDQSTDVATYHILLQEPVWRDMTGRDLMPGSFQGFTFPLADRLFWLFRKAFGYRMGTAFNLWSVLLIYRQLRGLLELLCGGRCRRLQPLAALLITAQYDLMMQLPSYMVEVPAAVLLLESMYLLLKKCRGKEEMVIFAALQGFLVAFKMTQVIFVIPLLVLYIAKNRKRVTVPVFLVCFAVGALPVSIYLIHNAAQTGNPIFPYYNSLFKSVYTSEVNFKDQRWGPTNWKEILLWPAYAVLKPDWRQSEIMNPYTFSYGAAWCMAGAYALKRAYAAVKQRSGRNRSTENTGSIYPSFYLLLAGFVLLSSLLWSATTGHSRYYMGGFIVLLLWGISAAFWCFERAAVQMAAAVCMLALILPGPIRFGDKCLNAIEWSQRPSVLRNQEIYKAQLPLIGHDRIFGNLQQREHSEELLLLDVNSHYASLLNSRCPILSWKAMDNVGDEMYEEWAQRLTEDLRKGVVMDTMVSVAKGFVPDLEIIYENRLGVERIERIVQNIFWDKDIYLVQVRNPSESFCDLTKRRPAAFVRDGIVDIGQAENETEVQVSVGIPGLKNLLDWGLDSCGTGIVTVYGNWETAETAKSADGWTEEKDAAVLARIPIDLTEAAEQEITVVLPQKTGDVCRLGASLELEEHGGLASLAGVWVRTSLTGRQQLGDEVYYIREDGSVERGLYKDGDRRYGVNYYGMIRSGWHQDGEDWYYTDREGNYFTDWLYIDGDWYYLSEDGIMQTGWIHLDADYYLEESGKMVTGLHKIDGVWYKFDADGRLETDTPEEQDG